MPGRTLVVLAVLAALSVTAAAQTKKSSRPTPENVRSGTVVSLDAAAATITLKHRSGPDITYRLNEKTRILRGKSTVALDAFKPGDAVTVRFKKSSSPPTLYDLADKPSWEWLDRIRHETTLVTVKEVADKELIATEGADQTEVAYRVTAKTAWSKGGEEAGPDDFKPGDKVHVVPRLLPSGATMAIAVSDVSGEAAKLKERAGIYVTGTVNVINHQQRLLNLHSQAGDDRELAIASDCVVRRDSKDVTLAAVKPGSLITARVTRDEEGEKTVSRITIKTTSVARRKPTAKTGSRPIVPVTPNKTKPPAVVKD